MMGKGYEDLEAWQKAMDLVEAIYALTARFPDTERYGLTSQLRRAAVSVPSNIAEGDGTGSDGLFLMHVRRARGSVSEIETQLRIARRLRFTDASEVERLLAQTREVARLVTGFRRYLERKCQ